MLGKIKRFLTVLIIALGCSAFYIVGGYLYIDSEITPTEQNTSSVQYYSEAPENVGIMFELRGHKTYCFLDFYYKKLNVIFDAESFSTDDNIMGYPIDYSLKLDDELFAQIIDLVGGVELQTEEGILRYTGVQIVDMMNYSTDFKRYEREIIRKIFEKIGENGFSKQDFLYIIEKGDTAITVPICYYWTDYIKELCGSLNEVN